jgi:hypothetical protein
MAAWSQKWVYSILMWSSIKLTSRKAFITSKIIIKLSKNLVQIFLRPDENSELNVRELRHKMFTENSGNFPRYKQTDLLVF